MNHEIKNKYVKVKINSFGAQLNSLKKIDDEVEYIWQADEKYWNRHAPILFPIVGRLKDDEYIYKDKTYKMTQHGFARDCEFDVLRKDDDFLSFSLKSNSDSLEKYPFEFELIISYELIYSKLVISYEVKNLSEDEMLFSIGAHPAFNWPFEDETKESYYFEFDDIKQTNRFFLNEKGLVFDSEKLTIKDNKIQLNDELFKKDALVFNDLTISEVSLKNSENNRFLKMNFKGFPYLGLWSKPTGAPFVCIEPWQGIADFDDSSKIFEDKKGNISLKSDEVFSCFYSIEV